MVFPKARAVVAGLLFLAWLGYLGYLVAVARDPIVVSRPQILVSNLCVLAKIEERDGRPAPTVEVTRVLWTAADAQHLEGGQLTLPDLADLDRPRGWTGPGEYLLALTKRILNKETTYELTPLPVMPGFRPATVTLELLTAGPAPERVEQYLQKTLGIDAAQAKALVTNTPSRLKRFVPYEAAEKIETDLRRLEAQVHLSANETRIYRATEEVLRQFRELKPID